MSCTVIDMVTVSAALHRVPRIMWKCPILRLQRTHRCIISDPLTVKHLSVGGALTALALIDLALAVLQMLGMIPPTQASLFSLSW